MILDTKSVTVIDIRGRIELLMELRNNGILLPTEAKRILVICGSESAYEVMTSKDLLDPRLEIIHFDEICEYVNGEMCIRSNKLDGHTTESVVLVDVHKYSFFFLQSILTTYCMLSSIYIISDSDVYYKDDNVKKMITYTDKSLFWSARNSASIYHPDISFILRNLISSKNIVKMMDLVSERRGEAFDINVRCLTELDYSDLITFSHIISFGSNINDINENIRDILGYDSLVPRINEPMIIREDINVVRERREDEILVDGELPMLYVPANSIVYVKDVTYVGGKCFVLFEDFKHDLFKVNINMRHLMDLSVRPLGTDSVAIYDNKIGVDIEYAYCISPFDMTGKNISSAVVLFNNESGADIKYSLYNIIMGIKSSVKILTDMNYYLQ